MGCDSLYRLEELVKSNIGASLNLQLAYSLDITSYLPLSKQRTVGDFATQ